MLFTLKDLNCWKIIEICFNPDMTSKTLLLKKLKINENILYDNYFVVSSKFS